MYINIIIIDIRDIYVYCSLFILFGTDTLLIRIYLEFVSIIGAVIISEDNFDCCGYTDNSSYFYKSCYGIIIKKNISKFRSANYINILSCQKYPNTYNNLTLIEKVFIISIYSIILIIKLKPSNFGFFVLYYRI